MLEVTERRTPWLKAGERIPTAARFQEKSKPEKIIR